MADNRGQEPLPMYGHYPDETPDTVVGNGAGELPEGWRSANFLETVSKMRAKVGKVNQNAYEAAGLFPVIDQGAKFIAGYSNDEGKVYKGDLPVIIFGDHTRRFKYVDFSFVAGADGTKVLLPERMAFDPLYLYFAYTNLEIEDRGYNRHYSILKEKNLHIPPLDEQREIARVLDAVQGAREATEKVIAAARQTKRSMMDHLFTYGPVPLADSDTVATKDTEAGTIPEHWELARLGEVATVGSGGTPSRKEPSYWEGEELIPWVKTAEINYETIKITGESISRRGLEKSSARLFPKGTLLMAMYGQGVTRGRVAMLGVEAAINQACAAITSDERMLSTFLYHLYSLKYEYLRTLGHGANQTNLSATIIKQIAVPIPPLDEQRRIVAALGAVDAKLSAEEARRDALSSLFSSLLEELMTGRLRVIDLSPEALPEAAR